MTALGQHGLVDAATNTANMAMTLAAGTPSWANTTRIFRPAAYGWRGRSLELLMEERRRWPRSRQVNTQGCC